MDAINSQESQSDSGEESGEESADEFDFVGLPDQYSEAERKCENLLSPTEELSPADSDTLNSAMLDAILSGSIRNIAERHGLPEDSVVAERLQEAWKLYKNTRIYDGDRNPAATELTASPNIQEQIGKDEQRDKRRRLRTKAQLKKNANRAGLDITIGDSEEEMYRPYPRVGSELLAVENVQVLLNNGENTEDADNDVSWNPSLDKAKKLFESGNHILWILHHAKWYEVRELVVTKSYKKKSAAGAASELTCSLINPVTLGENQDEGGTSISRKISRTFFELERYGIEENKTWLVYGKKVDS